MRQTWYYILENIKTGERIQALQKCKGWRVIEKRSYSFTESGLC